jgi:hypothetical protein
MVVIIDSLPLACTGRCVVARISGQICYLPEILQEIRSSDSATRTRHFFFAVSPNVFKIFTFFTALFSGLGKS